MLRLCGKHGVRAGPLVIVAQHCRALFHLRHRHFAEADKAWQTVEQLQGPDSPQRPRTLNYLALSRECQGKHSEAEALYRKARRLQEDNPQAFPVTHFATLWRLANVVDRRGRHAEARALLEEAITVVERARLLTYGDAEQRAAFFAQFEPGLEQLVAWSVRDGDVNGAVVAAAPRPQSHAAGSIADGRCRSARGCGSEGAALRLREAKLRRQIAALRARLNS